MPLNIMGEHPLATDERGNLKCRIATLFVRSQTLVTLPGVHATQRFAFTAMLNKRRQARGAPALTPEAEQREWEDAVDLIVDRSYIQIRPDPDRMALAFEADQLLQELEGVSKRHIRWLYVRQERVQQAIRRRGEYWRIAPLPQSPRDIVKMIIRSRIAIDGEAIYYYSVVSGTRYLTLQQLTALAGMDDIGLRHHLTEISAYANRNNRLGHQELELFAADGVTLRELFDGFDPRRVDPMALRAWHRRITQRVHDQVPPDLRDDTTDNLVWRNRMFSCLMGESDQTTSREVLRGINPEFFMQIRWLPGGRIEHGELMFDPVFSEREQRPADRELRALCDERVKGFICNYVREFGNLEYINIGQVAPAMRRRSRAEGGHRAYIAEVRHRAAGDPVLRIIRLQKWGIHEHLDEGKDLLQSIMEAENYTDYILDRRLGCWQLGMPLPARIMNHRINEVYHGSAARYRGMRIWTTYFERDYIKGVATDKIPAAAYRDPRFVVAFGRLLGRVAASNMVVGRTTLDNQVIFDGGDEILTFDEEGIPRDIIVADHAGTFTDYVSPLETFAEAYARPVLKRRDMLADPQAFGEAYIEAFTACLTDIQKKYRIQRRAFDTLFKHSNQDEGAFAWRWAGTLARLDQTDGPALASAIHNAMG